MYLFPQTPNPPTPDSPADDEAREVPEDPRPRPPQDLDLGIAAVTVLLPAVGLYITTLISRLTPDSRPLVAGELVGGAVALTVAFVASLLSGFTARTVRSSTATPAKAWLYPVGVGTAWFVALYATATKGTYLVVVGAVVASMVVTFGVPLLKYIVGTDRPDRVTPRGFWKVRATALNPTGARGWTYAQWASVLAVLVVLLAGLALPTVRGAAAEDLARLAGDLTPVEAGAAHGGSGSGGDSSGGGASDGDSSGTAGGTTTSSAPPVVTGDFTG